MSGLKEGKNQYESDDIAHGYRENTPAAIFSFPKNVLRGREKGRESFLDGTTPIRLEDSPCLAAYCLMPEGRQGTG